MTEKRPTNWPFHWKSQHVIALYSNGMVDWLYDEMELGWRVAQFLDSENNTPDVHFCGWGPFPPFPGE